MGRRSEHWQMLGKNRQYSMHYPRVRDLTVQADVGWAVWKRKPASPGGPMWVRVDIGRVAACMMGNCSMIIFAYLLAGACSKRLVHHCWGLPQLDSRLLRCLLQWRRGEETVRRQERHGVRYAQYSRLSACCGLSGYVFFVVWQTVATR